MHSHAALKVCQLIILTNEESKTLHKIYNKLRTQQAKFFNHLSILELR